MVIIMEHLFVVLVIIVIVTAQELLHRAERRDLVNRIMSRDVSEYKAYTEKYGKKKQKRESAAARAYRLNRGEGV